MIKNELEKMINAAMHAKEKNKIETLRALKTAIVNWEVSKEAIGKTYNETVEITIVKKLANEYTETAKLCNDGAHEELVKNAEESANYLLGFLPKEPTNEEIIAYIDSLQVNRNILPIKKNMGLIIKSVKEAFPVADGKKVSELVKTILAE